MDEKTQVAEQANEAKERKRNKAVLWIGAGIILLLLIVAGGGFKAKTPNYESSARTYSQLYIEENYYSDAEFDYRSVQVLSVESVRRYDITGKFSHGGEVYTFEVIGEFPKSNTTEYRIEYVAINNQILLDAIGK